MIQAGTHHNYVLLAGVGMAEHISQVVQIARIAHSHQDIAGSHSHRATYPLLIAVDDEVIKLFRLALALFGDLAFVHGEYREEERAKDDPRYGGFVLLKQI